MLHSGCCAHTLCSIVVILTEGFHLTAACWGMLGGRNKELNKLCYSSPLHVWERVNAMAAALRLHTVLLCLFYFVSSINDEAPGARERERGTQPSLGEKCSLLGTVPSASPTSPNITGPWQNTPHFVDLDTCKTTFQNSEVSLHSLISPFFIQMNFNLKLILASIKT